MFTQRKLSRDGVQILSELQSHRRTGSTEDLDSPMSNPDSPGWVMNMRSQSLAALGIAPASPRTQRQLLASGRRQTPASMLGAKRLPQHASSSRLAALGEHVSNAELKVEESPAQEDAQGDGVASRKGGKHKAQPPHARRDGGKRRLSRSPPDRLAAPVRRSRLTNHDSQASGSGAHSAPDSDTSHQSASSSSAVVSSDEEAAEDGDSVLEDQVPSLVGRGNHRVEPSVRGSRHRIDSARAGEERLKTANAPSDAEEWTESPVTRSSRTVKRKTGLRQSSASSNPRVLAARKAATGGGRRRSEKLSNFSGVTLKNGRCGWVTQHYLALSTVDHILDSMLHGGCHTTLTFSSIHRQCCDCVCFCMVHAVNQACVDGPSTIGAYILKPAAASAFLGIDMPG